MSFNKLNNNEKSTNTYVDQKAKLQIIQSPKKVRMIHQK
jgi:hypothetical protein